MMSEESEFALRKEIIDVSRALQSRGLIKGTSGNVSARCGGGFLVTPTGIPYEDLTADKIVFMDMDGRFEGPVLPSSEWRFHRDVLSSFPHFNAVVHTHSPYATAVSIQRREIPAIHYRIAVVGGENNSLRALCHIRHAGTGRCHRCRSSVSSRLFVGASRNACGP